MPQWKEGDEMKKEGSYPSPNDSTVFISFMHTRMLRHKHSTLQARASIAHAQYRAIVRLCTDNFTAVLFSGKFLI